MMRRPALRSSVWLILAAALAATLTAVARAPAAWVGDWLQSQGRLRLIDARGTLWNGTAMLALSDGRQMTLLPGRVAWRIELASGRLAARFAHPWLAAPLSLSLGADGVALKAGNAELPAAALTALGAPFNTARPGGVLELRWSDLDLRGGAFAGELQIDWRAAQSALSTVAPLGDYRLRVSGTGDGARLRLDTLSGPLRLEGNGSLKAGRVRFNGIASAEPEMRAALNGLLGVLGPRSGDNALLSLDT
jgi:general secretion pathway protein N